MTSAERITAAVSHREADRVPFVLPVMLHGAKLLGIPLRDYFASADAVAGAQLRLQERYGHDAIIALFYAAIEHEAWGGTVKFFDDGPPNAGAPLLRRHEDVRSLRAPAIEQCPALQRMLAAIRIMRRELGDRVPVIGAVVAPHSVPVMQLGFEAYLDLLLEDRAGYEHLMRTNEAFAVAWANAQVEAGASVIVYFDPLASPTVLPRPVYRETGWPVARRVIAAVNAPVGVGLASGRALPILDDLADAGAVAVGVSQDDDLAAAKARAGERLALMGNLNGVAMRRWSDAEAEAAVRRAIDAGAPGGGFVLGEHHGEIPFQVRDDTLMAVAEAVSQWGTYPRHA